MIVSISDAIFLHITVGYTYTPKLTLLDRPCKYRLSQSHESGDGGEALHCVKFLCLKYNEPITSSEQGRKLLMCSECGYFNGVVKATQERYDRFLIF